MLPRMNTTDRYGRIKRRKNTEGDQLEITGWLSVIVLRAFLLIQIERKPDKDTSVKITYFVL